jgi:hypothetical protein
LGRWLSRLAPFFWHLPLPFRAAALSLPLCPFPVASDTLLKLDLPFEVTDCLDVIHYSDVRDSLDVTDYLDVMDYLDVIGYLDVTDFFHCEFDVDFVSRLESLQTWSAV